MNVIVRPNEWEMDTIHFEDRVHPDNLSKFILVPLTRKWHLKFRPLDLAANSQIGFSEI